MPEAISIEETWRVYLARSSDPRQNLWDLTPSQGVQLQLALNKAGQCSLSVPLISEVAMLVEPITTCLVVWQGDEAVWSGPVWTLEESADANTLQINAVGWFELLNHRLIANTAHPKAQSFSLMNPTAASNASYWTAAGDFDWVSAGATIRRRTDDFSSSPASFIATRDLAIGPGQPWMLQVIGAFASNNFYPDITYTVSGKLKYRASLNFNSEATRIDISLGGNQDSSFMTLSGTTMLAYFNTWRDFRIDWTPSAEGYTPPIASTPFSNPATSFSVLNSPVGLFFELSGKGTSATFALGIDSLAVTYAQTQPPYAAYSSVDAGAIVSDLVSLVKEVHPLEISMGTVQTSTPRTRSVKKYEVLGKVIQELSDLESGFDWTIDPLDKTLNIWAKYGSSPTNVAFGFRAGPNNLRSAKRTIDSSVLANNVIVAGKYGLFQDTDVASASFYGRFDDYITLSDVGDPSILDAMASIEVAFRNQPRALHQFNPYPPNESFLVSRVYRDYWLGDTVSFSANYGRMVVDRQNVRIFELSFTLDENGYEKVDSIGTSADSG